MYDCKEIVVSLGDQGEKMVTDEQMKKVATRIGAYHSGCVSALLGNFKSMFDQAIRAGLAKKHGTLNARRGKQPQQQLQQPTTSTTTAISTIRGIEEEEKRVPFDGVHERLMEYMRACKVKDWKLGVPFGWELKELPSEWAEVAPHLKELRFSSNLFSVLPDWISTATSLTELLLDRNRFKHLPEDVFCPLSNLTQLDLSENKLHSLPTSICGLSNLDRKSTRLNSSHT